MEPQFRPPKADGSPPYPRPVSLMNNPALPTCDLSHINETGEYEVTGLQATSAWADIGADDIPGVKDEPALPVNV